MEKNEDNISLQIESKSWIKDTEDLFDFETKDIKYKSFNLTNENKISYLISTLNENNENEIELIRSNKVLQDKINSNPKTIKVISEIIYNKQNSNFSFINPLYSENFNKLFTKENCERIWKNNSKNEEIEIHENDIFKLGRVRLKFDKIIFNNNTGRNNTLNTGINIFNTNSHINILNNSNNNISNIIFNNSITGEISANEPNENLKNALLTSEKYDFKYNCRICYRNDSDINDPLISPCKCSGSMGYIHFKCLKSCIDAKIQKKKEENFISYTWKSFNCEICLYPYPKYIKFKNMIYPLVDIDTSKFNQYCLCDYSLFDDNQKKAFHRGYIIFKIEDDNEITLGRNQSNGVKLKDISVSRKHCYIIKRNGKLYIKDLNSKFGTLQYIKKKFDIQIDDNLDLLSGKNRFQISLSKKWSFLGLGNIFKFGCCSCRQINDNDEYIFEEDKNFNTNIHNEIVNKRESFKFDSFKFNDNDSYNDYILHMNHIIGIPNETETPNININMVSTNNNRQKDDSYTNL